MRNVKCVYKFNSHLSFIKFNYYSTPVSWDELGKHLGQFGEEIKPIKGDGYCFINSVIAGIENLTSKTLTLAAILRPKTIGYDPFELKAIQLTVLNQHDHRYKVLPIEAIKTIRMLRLNHKRRRHLYTAQKRTKL